MRLLSVVILILNLKRSVLNIFEEYDDGGSNLDYLGSRIYGTPDPNASDKVKKWRPGYRENPEFLGTYAEGDILFSQKRLRNGVVRETRRWPLGYIPYEVSGDFWFFERFFIFRAMAAYHKETCLRFIERSSWHNDYVYIQKSEEGCYSSVGRTGGKQIVNLQTPNCLRAGTIIHELMHSAGFAHEHARYDRDDYVYIIEDNVDKDMFYNFDKCSPSTYTNFNVSYDFQSIMHYSSYAFTKQDGLPTMLAKDGVSKLGLADYFSKKDIIKVNRMYKCRAAPTFNFTKLFYLCVFMLFL